MPNILLTRIDNRLIHGQVGMTWVNHLGANLILVANDKVAADSVQQNLMDMAVPPTVETRYFTLSDTIEKINFAGDWQQIFLVIKTPQDALKLVEGGVHITILNIGNMHFSEGKKQVTSTISVDESDKQAIRKLMDLGVEIELRRVPDEPAIDVAKVFE
jgi:PTS system N-acetylgalactosamine-specific IIB component